MIKHWLNDKILYHADESFKTALTIIIQLQIQFFSVFIQLKTAINNLRPLHITSYSYMYIQNSLDIFRQPSSIPEIKSTSIFYIKTFKFLLFLPNVQVHLTFHHKYEEKLLLFFLDYFTVLHLYSIVLKFLEKHMEIRASKVMFYKS